MILSLIQLVIVIPYFINQTIKQTAAADPDLEPREEGPVFCQLFFLLRFFFSLRYAIG